MEIFTMSKNLSCYIYPKKTSAELYQFLCALWHCLISSRDQCPTSSFIQTNALIFSILGCLICSLPAKMSQTAVFPLLDHVENKHLTSLETRVAFTSDFSDCPFISHTWFMISIDIFNHIVLETKELNKINLWNKSTGTTWVCTTACHDWQITEMENLDEMSEQDGKYGDHRVLLCFII